MVHRELLLYFNVAPYNPNGITQVDLGEMDEGLEVTRTRHSSLPPSSSTLPPKPTKTRLSSPAGGLDEVSEGESEAIALSAVGRGETVAPSVGRGETVAPSVRETVAPSVGETVAPSVGRGETVAPNNPARVS